MKSIVIILLFISIMSTHCFSQIIGNKKEIYLRTDGVYSTYNTSVSKGNLEVKADYFTYNHLNVINSDNIIYSNGIGSYDNHFLKIKSYQNRIPMLGSYKIISDTIHAFDIPISLMAWGGKLKIYHANFIGIIKNTDTIVQWRMISPYPNANKRLNDNFKFELTPKLLYFIESKELLGLDSLYKIKLTEMAK